METIVKENKNYSTSVRKMIYVVQADNSNGMWPAYNGSLKVGDTSIDTFEIDAHPNSDDLRRVANKRVSEYMKTTRVPYHIQWAELAYRRSNQKWFRDYDVHNVLQRSGYKRNANLDGNGGEWYMTDTDAVKEAIQAVKSGKAAIHNNYPIEKPKIKLRPEQKKAVEKTKKAFHKKSNDRFLWNAKMRFGKTLTALQLIKEQKYSKVLIMTHRPEVNQSWIDDFNKMDMSKNGYDYGSKKKDETLKNLYNSNNSFIYFASIQDLGGSSIVNGDYDKNNLVFDIDWDLVIIDEAHEGTQTKLTQNIIKHVKKDNTKLLELSGTPFNILNQYNDDQVFTWNYVMEQDRKNNWNKEHPNEVNPYEKLPKVSMYTFRMHNNVGTQFINPYSKSFNFKEFFKLNNKDEFVYKSKVWQFLNNITTPNSKTNYPFSTKKFRDNLRHTLWILPGVKEAKALYKLMMKHPVFGMEYNIINIVNNGDEDVANQNDVDRVYDAMGSNPANSKTVTLTVRKLTTGVTIKPWTGVVFLSNTNSAMQYLQAAFRVQTPYEDDNGIKNNCYIFDFAPDRALTVMAESSQVSIEKGKLNSESQKKQMGQLLNFLPIIGEEGQGMKKYDVDKLLTKMKRAYAEKAVRTGFDDDSIYNDNLLKLDNVDLKDFNKLKAIVGTTKQQKKPVKVDVNKQNLTNEEYENAEKARKKQKKQRTPEEQANINKENKAKKQRKTMVSILRSVSIRIPLMIYGLDVSLNQNIELDQFVDKVDSASWQEFMPAGVDKKMFKKFEQFYDAQVFVEAGRIIRDKVHDLDLDENNHIDPIERAEQISLIFNGFKNPDKETVLTPWRVVNMQLGKTIGGYSYYDKDYKYNIHDGKNVEHWIDIDLTDQVFKDDTNILEINSKTGLYPLYVATSLYNKKMNELNNRKAGKFNYNDQLNIWKDILKNNIYVLAKTPMARDIAERTLLGYKHFNTNVKYIDSLVDKAKDNINKCAKLVKEKFNIMKFDAVIGNPPYQAKAKTPGRRNEPIYNLFMDLSYKLSDTVSLITPGRFLFNAGQTPKSWNKKILNDNHIKIVNYYQNSDSVFPRTDIKGGVVITLKDISKDFEPIGIFTPYKQLNFIIKKVWDNSNVSDISDKISSRGLFRFSDLFFNKNRELASRLGKGSNNMIVSNSFERLPEIFLDNKPNDNYVYLKMLGRLNSKRIYKYIRRDYVQDNDYINNYKILIPEANGTGAIGEVLSTPLIGSPLIGSTDTFISFGPFDTKSIANAALKYIKSRFARTMLGVKKATQHNPRSTWIEVPLQDFTNDSDIDWSQSIDGIDQQLYKKYNLNKAEIDFIEKNVQRME